MNLNPSPSLNRRQTTKGLDLVIKEGLTSEAMVALTGGTFLVAMAILLGASNFQIGLLASLPTLANVFQLIAIRLLQRYNNRRVITVICNGFARFPLLVIGALLFLFSSGTSIKALIFLLFFHYFFGSIAGASWNAWMKDLVPERKLGSYFSQRTKVTQTLNVFLSLMLALGLDYIKRVNPGAELTAYALMFMGGGLLGLIGTWLLSRTPEPQSFLPKENFFKLFKKPLKDGNFRNLLFFNSFWAFALGIATPFFTVFMMKTLELSLSYIIFFAICGQVAGILAIKQWGKYCDHFSNKTVIKIAAPLYILCILAWPFAKMPHTFSGMIIIVAAINIFSGIATSGINLAITNIGMKLAPKNEAIVFLSAKNMVVALFSALGPLLGGFFADYFANRSFHWKIEWQGPKGMETFSLLELHNLGFLFMIGGLLAIVALRTLAWVKEEGEMPKEIAMAEMKNGFRHGLKSTNRKALLRAPLQIIPLQKKHKRLKRARA